MGGEIGGKWCPDCQAFKPVSDFTSNKSALFGLSTYCGPHGRSRLAVSYQRNRERHLQQMRDQYQRYKVERPEQLAEQRRRSREKLKARCLDDAKFHEEYRAKLRETQRRYQAKNPERARKLRRARYERMLAKNPALKRKWHLKARYGMTIAEYEALLERQNGVCAICEKTCSTGLPLSVDHNHLTGEKRGLLCKSCNTSIGKYMDDFDMFDRVLSYATRYPPANKRAAQ